MGLFATSNDVKRLRRTILELQDDVTELKRTSRSLELEFTELYDKVRHQMSRMSKRDAHRDKVLETPEEEILDDDGVIGSDRISQSILLRRARGAMKP